jgi:hypothetical protein
LKQARGSADNNTYPSAVLQMDWQNLFGKSTPVLVHENTCLPALGPFRLPIYITEISHRSDFNPLKLVTCPISADREFSIEIGSVADLKIKNLEIVNKITNNVDIVSAQAPNLLNIILWYRRKTFLCVNTWPIIKF